MKPLDPHRAPVNHDEALRASEDKFAKAFRTTPDTMVITDRASGVFIEVNPAFERQFGWSQSEATGRTSSELNIWASPAERQRML
ncbi:MAG: PAS domain S-box protein, partial [Pseudomonas sp.]|nr:PAS domain S-box protein [Pseudomonas sp.]